MSVSRQNLNLSKPKLEWGFVTCESRLQPRLLVLLVGFQHERWDSCHCFPLIWAQVSPPQGREIDPPRHLSHLLLHQWRQEELKGWGGRGWGVLAARSINWSLMKKDVSVKLTWKNRNRSQSHQFHIRWAWDREILLLFIIFFLLFLFIFRCFDSWSGLRSTQKQQDDIRRRERAEEILNCLERGAGLTASGSRFMVWTSSGNSAKALKPQLATSTSWDSKHTQKDIILSHQPVHIPCFNIFTTNILKFTWTCQLLEHYFLHKCCQLFKAWRKDTD